MFDIRLVVFWQPPALRVRIVGNPCLLTATSEEAARPVIIIRESVALPVIDACLLAFLVGVGLELREPFLAFLHGAFPLV